MFSFLQTKIATSWEIRKCRRVAYMDYGFYDPDYGFCFSWYANSLKKTYLCHKIRDAMEKDLLNIETVTEYNELLGVKTLHPLVSVIDLSKVRRIGHLRHTFGFYVVFLKEVKCGDLMKKETGKTAQEHIQLKLIELAKDMVLNPEHSISQISYELGFQYPQHFSRMFKKVVGMTPNEYREKSVS